ncbi:MAG: hypothetical protein KDJ98_08225 [Rhodobacteraceae bacterium]|nr:hypothetical protein [Paracoccaceae bacterium]
MSPILSARQHNLPGPGRARFRVEYVTGRGYQVVDPDGRIVLQPTQRDIAEAKRAALQAALDTKARRGPRPCLCCGRVFESEGIHNRMCAPCRGRDDPLAGYGFSGSADGRKSRAISKG